MKKKVTKILSMVLISAMLITTIPPASAEASNSSSDADNCNSNLINDVSVTGTNSFGKMFSETYYENYLQQETTGYGVYSVDFTENVADISFDTLENATIVVGLFDENDSSSMITSEEIEVSKDETTAQITFDSENMPEYFYIKAYLVDSETFRPLSSEYTSPMYTSDMKYLEQLSTTDFPDERVLNLDDDTENNFAIYNSSIKTIFENTETNIVSTVDDTNGIYVFENIDSSISSLQVGDTFSYDYGDDGLIIAKIAEITIDGTTATIKSAEIDMEEVFDYVKINVEPSINDAEICVDELPEGVEYNGLISNSTAKSGRVVSSGASSVDFERKLSFGLNDVSVDEIYKDFTGTELPDNNIMKYLKISGGLDLQITPGVEFNLTSENKYFEFKIDYSIGVKVSFSTKKDIVSSTKPESSKDTQPFFVISIGYIKFTHISGVSIKITPGVAFSASGELELSGTLSGTVGFSVSNNGFENITTNPKFETEIKIEASIFVGIDLNPELSFLAEFASAKLDGVLGIEATASMSIATDTNELLCIEPSVHDCDLCIDGELVGKFNLSFSTDILDIDFLTFNADLLNIEFKITDFYYSFDNNSFGFSECPYQKHRITATVVDSSGEPIEFTNITVKDTDGNIVKISDVNDYEITDENGKVSFYLKPGEYKITASKGTDVTEADILTYKDTTKKLIVVNNAKSVHISLYTLEESLDDYYNQNNSTPSQLSLGGVQSSYIAENGDLYMWGNNQLNPTKVMTNVKDVSLGIEHSACVTKDGNLYTWGANSSYQLGDGTTNPQNVPIQIMSNVKSVSLGTHHSACITENGDLYMWGYNGYGEIGTGDEKTKQYLSPQFIMSNVKQVSLGYFHSACITENGDLYMWGYNLNGELGIGNENFRGVIYSPEFVMSNVKQVSLGGDHSGAITEDGELYMWGANHNGELGDGTNARKSSPTKITSITEKIKELDLCSIYTGVITENGDIYTWGSSYGKKNTPTKITLTTKESTANLSTNKSLNSILSTAANTAGVVSAGTGTAQSFEGLMPNEVYNFYAMKSENAAEPLSSENLLYIAQATSDENGKLSINYTMTEAYENAVCFVVPMKQTDLSNATVTMDNLVYTGNEQFIHPTVTLDGVTLTEGKDYELCNYYYAENVGEYSVIISGIGSYSGKVEFTYYVNGMLGDINIDGNLSAVDAILLLRHIINSSTLNEQQQISADINKDGEITVVDAILLQRAIVNMTTLE